MFINDGSNYACFLMSVGTHTVHELAINMIL